MSNNPYPENESEPKTLHIGFLKDVPMNADIEALENIKTESERFKLIGKVFYLSAPEGIGRSKLALKSEKLLGVPMTSRNWRTVSKIGNMLNE